jgi:hypothetical protein
MPSLFFHALNYRIKDANFKAGGRGIIYRKCPISSERFGSDDVFVKPTYRK